MTWETRSHGYGTVGLAYALADGWEPFAAVQTRGNDTLILVRRQVGAPSQPPPVCTGTGHHYVGVPVGVSQGGCPICLHVVGLDRDGRIAAHAWKVAP